MSEKAWAIRKNLPNIMMEKIGDKEIPADRESFELLLEFADEPPKGRNATEDDISFIVEHVGWLPGLRFEFLF